MCVSVCVCQCVCACVHACVRVHVCLNLLCWLDEGACTCPLHVLYTHVCTYIRKYCMHQKWICSFMLCCSACVLSLPLPSSFLPPLSRSFTPSLLFRPLPPSPSLLPSPPFPLISHPSPLPPSYVCTPELVMRAEGLTQPCRVCIHSVQLVPNWSFRKCENFEMLNLLPDALSSRLHFPVKVRIS